MNNIEQLTRLYTDKCNDKTVKEQISFIQQSCKENIDSDQIAIIFHECDYNIQKTIQRIHAKQIQNSELQTGKFISKNKFINHHDLISNQQNQLRKSTINNRPLKFNRIDSLFIQHDKQMKSIRSTIPIEPVRMHSTMKYSFQPIDIQFGDIQWNNCVPNIIPTNDFNQHQTNITDETTIITNQLSSSITDHAISNIVPIENTSHLSDQLTQLSLTTTTNSDIYPSQQVQSVNIPITRLPPTSTPRIQEYSSSFIPSTSYNPYPSVTNQWTTQTSNYRTNSKGNIHPSTSYQLPTQQQQQQIFLSTYPYPTLSPTIVQVFAPIDHWSHHGYTAPIGSYTYSTTNYISTYPNQLQTKYDQQSSYDKEHFHQTQLNKDTHLTSKLSPTAVAFSQGIPLTTSPSATAFYINPVPFTMPSYYHHYPASGQSIENRNNHSNVTNRSNYYQHAQTSRTYNTHISNSTCHSQQSM